MADQTDARQAKRILSLLGVSTIVTNAQGVPLCVSEGMPLDLSDAKTVFEALPVLVGMEALFEQFAGHHTYTDTDTDIDIDNGDDASSASLVPLSPLTPLHLRHVTMLDRQTENQAVTTFGLRVLPHEPGQVLLVISHDEEDASEQRVSVQATNTLALHKEIAQAQSKARLFSTQQVDVVGELTGSGIRGRIAKAHLALPHGDENNNGNGNTTGIYQSVCEDLTQAMLAIDALALAVQLAEGSNANNPTMASPFVLTPMGLEDIRVLFATDFEPNSGAKAEVNASFEIRLNRLALELSARLMFAYADHVRARAEAGANALHIELTSIRAGGGAFDQSVCWRLLHAMARHGDKQITFQYDANRILIDLC